MRKPLDLEPIRERRGNILCSVLDRDALLAEVERLRGEVARQAEQITAVRALHVEEIDRGDPTGYCCDCEQRFPCNTASALRGGAS